MSGGAGTVCGSAARAGGAEAGPRYSDRHGREGGSTEERTSLVLWRATSEAVYTVGFAMAPGDSVGEQGAGEG